MKLRFTLLFLLLFGLAACTPAEETPVVDEGVYNGMSAEELMDAGYVLVATGKPIRIGASVALTGPIPEPGRDIANGAELGVDALNAAGGLMGYNFELVLEDGGCDGDQGTTVGNKFAADPSIVAVSGGTCSGETFGLKPILNKARIPFVSPSATNPSVTAECDTCNRVALSDALQGVVDAEYVYNELGNMSVAVLHDNSDYGLGLAEVFKSHFEILGGTVTSFEGIQVDNTDFRAVLTQVAAGSPELIFFGGYATEAGLLAQQMQETGLEDAGFFSDDGAKSEQYLDAAGDASEGTYLSFVSGDESETMNADFDQKYLDKYGVSPDELGPFHAQSYDSVMLIGDAIKRVAKEGNGYLVINREELVSAVRATSGLTGLTGNLSCDANGECGAGGIQIFQVQKGEFVQVSGYGK